MTIIFARYFRFKAMAIFCLFTALVAGASLMAPSAHAASFKKVKVIGVPDDVERLKVNFGTCAAEFFCEKRKKPGSFTYNSQVYGSPKFRPGTVTLHDGSLIKGHVALLQRRQVWKFVKHMALIVPEGEEEAIYVGPGDALLITQESKKKGLKTYDMYGTVYLERRVSGPLRLSYNPAAGTTRGIADFLPAGTIEGLQRQIAGREIIAAIKDGRNLADVRDGGTASQALVGVISAVEITEKEYLVFDEAAGTTSLITKANHRDAMGQIFANCPQVDAKTAKSYSKSFKAIDEAFEYINASCFP